MERISAPKPELSTAAESAKPPVAATVQGTPHIRHPWLHLLIGGTLLVQLIWLLLCGPRYDYASDDRGYLESARILAETGVLTYNDPTQPTLFITPGLPAVLALLGRVIGTWEPIHLAQAFRLVQAGCAAASLYVLVAIGTRLFSRRAALGAVAVTALYPPFWMTTAFVFTEALFTLLLLLLVLAAMRTLERPSVWRAGAFGLIWAAAVYVRPTIALWPGFALLLLLAVRHLPWRLLLRLSIPAALVFLLALLPWWARNYEVSGGHFIPLTKSGGNPLLLGTYPFTVPAMFLDEQRNWHKTNDLRVNDEQDTKRALERLREGFREKPLVYVSWYTVGKFALFWGDVFYWMAIPGIPLAAAIGIHYTILFIGAVGVYRFGLRRRSSDPPPALSRIYALLILSLFAYMSLLHMVYLAHSRYAVPLMPLLSLFAVQWVLERRRRKPNFIFNDHGETQL